MAIMVVISFFGYRHYKLEAEILSMAWKVSWNDVLPCNAINKQRGSLYSIAKRGSQLVSHTLITTLIFMSSSILLAHADALDFYIVQIHLNCVCVCVL